MPTRCRTTEPASPEHRASHTRLARFVADLERAQAEANHAEGYTARACAQASLNAAEACYGSVLTDHLTCHHGGSSPDESWPTADERATHHEQLHEMAAA